MKKLIYTLLASAAALLSLASCNRNEPVRMTEGVSVTGNTVTATLTVDDPVCLDTETGETMTYNEFLGGSEGTKSVYGGDDDIKRISNLALAIYDESKDSAPEVYWFSNAGSVKFTLPDKNHTYTIYTFANFFKDKSEASSVLSGYTRSQMDGFKYKFSKNDNFKTWGFPMAKKIAGYSLSNPQSFSVRSLVCKVGLRIKDLPSNVKLTNFTFKLQRSPNTVMPFADKFSVVSESELFLGEDNVGNDILSTAEIQALASGGTVYMYLLENMMGDLMPGNSDVTKKEPKNVQPPSKGSLVSFYEINTDVTVDGIIAYKAVKFRFALGKDNITNFDCPRNHCLSCGLSFSDLVYSTGWYIDANDPTFLGNLFLDKTELGVIGDITDQLVIIMDTPTGVNFDFEVVATPSQKAAAQLEFTTQDVSNYQGSGKTARVVTFSTKRSINGFYTFGKDPEYMPVTVAIQSVKKHNGIPYIKKEVTVKVYDKLFPIYFHVDHNYATAGANGKAKLMAFSENPLRLPLSFETKVNYGFGDQQNYAGGVQTITGTNDFKGLLHSKYEFAKYYTKTVGVNNVPTFTLTDNTVNREGKVIHEWNVRQLVNGVDGYNGLKIDIDIVPLSTYSKPYGALNGYPQFKSGTTFYMGGDCYKEDQFLTLDESKATYIGKMPGIERPNITYSGDIYEYYAYADNAQAAFHYNCQKNSWQKRVDLSIVPKIPSTSEKDPYGYHIKTGYTYPDKGSTVEHDKDFLSGKYRAAYCNSTVNADYSWTEYRKCPFYVINGGMIIDGFIYRDDENRTNGITVNEYGNGSKGWLALYREPGRDLGVIDYRADIAGGSGYSQYQTMYLYIGTGGTLVTGYGTFNVSAKNPIFKSRMFAHGSNIPTDRAYIDWGYNVRSNIPMFGIWGAYYKDGLFHQDATVWQGHNYSIRMKVNGCTNWPGATNDKIGGFRYFED